ncbi:hypothetical protein ACHHRT_05030 [Desulfurivibrio sp. D14AmB]|uniref:hypothetical protein n=1 Tax=Desulfurivibrio sp. D14AmB TaxID=3374370 RepID=UPI00376ECE7F
MTRRALRPSSSLWDLKRSSSSMTDMGSTTVLSAKELMESALCSRTLVSRTKYFGIRNSPDWTALNCPPGALGNGGQLSNGTNR